jgi:hypothetical protein
MTNPLRGRRPRIFMSPMLKTLKYVQTMTTPETRSQGNPSLPVGDVHGDDLRIDDFHGGRVAGVHAQIRAHRELRIGRGMPAPQKQDDDEASDDNASASR